MKKNFSVIQIKGIRGILYLAFIGICLAVGFGWFPGWLCMKAWNLSSSYFIQLPSIGIIQGMLLWGILAGAYFTFRKDRLVVCMKASEGLNEDELREVFANLKKQVQDDTFLRDMMKAHHAELKIKNLSESNIPNITNKTTNNEQKEKVQSK